MHLLKKTLEIILSRYTYENNLTSNGSAIVAPTSVFASCSNLAMELPTAQTETRKLMSAETVAPNEVIEKRFVYLCYSLAWIYQISYS